MRFYTTLRCAIRTCTYSRYHTDQFIECLIPSFQPEDLSIPLWRIATGLPTVARSNFPDTMSGQNMQSNNSRMQSPSRYTTLVFTLSYMFPGGVFVLVFVFLIFLIFFPGGQRLVGTAHLNLPNRTPCFSSRPHQERTIARTTNLTDHNPTAHLVHCIWTWTSRRPTGNISGHLLVFWNLKGPGQPSMESHLRMKSNICRKTHASHRDAEVSTAWIARHSDKNNGH